MIMVTAAEQEAARRWLAKRGQRVERPTPVLTALIATRQAFNGRWFPRYIGYVLLVFVGGLGYTRLFGPGMTESYPVYFIYFALQLAARDSSHLRLRELRESVPSRKPAEPWWQVLGGWFLASVAVAFGGGIALAVTMYATTPARTYAVSWLGLLALSALVSGWVLVSVLRRPLIADGAESLAVARALRVEAINAASPLMAVLPLVMDPLLGNRQPAAFTPWLAGYVVLVLVLQVVGYVRHLRRSRTLPPGCYGTPLPDLDVPVDWSPPQEAR
ncbi:hypothetical protein OG439_31995 [Amycolatopsis sp. NBC_01307]|uniref:hypothetical protein n=1 Tax=Amycolatopsis sp. NBC_01307 TaxID=2903561 RepID=UPI002E12C96A|nr:hypothetical protein OG439_31995 [Amycolatopsis sp. NBC_01307]